MMEQWFTYLNKGGDFAELRQAEECPEGFEPVPEGFTLEQLATLRRDPADGRIKERLPLPVPTEAERRRERDDDLHARRADRDAAIEAEMVPYREDHKAGIVTERQLADKLALVRARYPEITS